MAMEMMNLIDIMSIIAAKMVSFVLTMFLNVQEKKTKK